MCANWPNSGLLSLSILNQSQRNRNNLISGRLTTNPTSVGRIALDIEQNVRLAVGDGRTADLLHGVIVKVHPNAVVDRERGVVAAAGAIAVMDDDGRQVVHVAARVGTSRLGAVVQHKLGHVERVDRERYPQVDLGSEN